MTWPMSQDYNEAVQSPATHFADPDLRGGKAVANALGLPTPCSGNFADVYQIRCLDGGPWAVKCFTREVHGLRERYSEISKHLQQVRLPFTVDFQYLEQGIRIGGSWYPVLKMHWVEGFTLNAFVRDSLDKPARLDAMARVWLCMAQRLREAGIAHGDLQHGNVLLVPDDMGQSLTVKLIDYDGMWVPALAGTPSGEVGHPAYQHPQRLREGTYGPEVDRFPLLAIYCAIRALAVGGRQLWERFDTGDNLLFRQQDFEAPGRSLLFAELLRMNHPEVRELAVTLIDAARTTLDGTPLLEEVVPNEGVLRAATAAAPTTQQTATPPEEVETAFEGVAEGGSVTGQSLQGRGMLMGALIGAAVFGLSCLGLGTLIFMGSGDKPDTSSTVAKIKTTPQSAKDDKPATKQVGETRNKSETKSEVDPPRMTVYRSQAVGGMEGGEPFADQQEQGTFLIGFAVKTRFQGNRTEIAFLHPIYWTPAGRKMAASGFGHPKDAQAHANIEGREGYAIGGLMVWSNFAGFHLVRGMKILFMRRKERMLDPKDSYWSEWIGLNGEGKGITLGGDGNPIIGIHGRAGGAINCLGIIQFLEVPNERPVPEMGKEQPLKNDSPGPGPVSVTNGDGLSYPLITVDLNAPATLGPGNYVASLLNHRFSLYSGFVTVGTVTPIVLTGNGVNAFTPVAVGNSITYNGPTAFVSTRFGGSDKFTLASRTTVYAGLYWNAPAYKGGPEYRMPIGSNNNGGLVFNRQSGANFPVVGTPISGGNPLPAGFNSRKYDFSIQIDPVATARQMGTRAGNQRESKVLREDNTNTIVFKTVKDLREIGETKKGARWTVTDGKLAASPDSVFWLKPRFAPPFWVRLRVTTGGTDQGLAFAPEPSYEKGQFWMISMLSRNLVNLRLNHTRDLSPHVPLEAGRHVIEGRITDDQVVVLIDGEERQRYRFEKNLPLPPRRVGFYTYPGDTGVESVSFGSGMSPGDK